MKSVFFEGLSTVDGKTVFIVSVDTGGASPPRVSLVRYRHLAFVAAKLPPQQCPFPPKTVGTCPPSQWAQRVAQMNAYWSCYFEEGKSLLLREQEAEQENDMAALGGGGLAQFSHKTPQFVEEVFHSEGETIGMAAGHARVLFELKFGATGYITRVELQEEFPDRDFPLEDGVLRGHAFSEAAAKDKTLLDYLTANMGRGFKGSLFDDQVAGHKGDAHMLLEGNAILKPFNEEEFLFYLNLYSCCGNVPPDVFPRCLGRRRIFEAAGATPKDYLALSNLCIGMTKPAIMDLKLGANSMGKTQSGGFKKVKQAFVQTTSTSGKVGLRIVGSKHYNLDGSVNEITQAKGNFLTVSGLEQQIQSFLSPLSQEALAALRDQISNISDWVRSQPALTLNSSSVLLLYDADNLELPPRARLIDFAHSFVAPTEDNESKLILPKRHLSAETLEHSRLKFVAGLAHLTRFIPK